MGKKSCTFSFIQMLKCVVAEERKDFLAFVEIESLLFGRKPLCTRRPEHCVWTRELRLSPEMESEARPSASGENKTGCDNVSLNVTV